MKYLATLLLILGFGLSAFGQTIKTLAYNTTNGQVVYSGTNLLTLTNQATVGVVSFNNTTNAASTRTNLGLGATWLTNTTTANFRSAIGLGTSNQPVFHSIMVGTNTNGRLIMANGNGDIYFSNNTSGNPSFWLYSIGALLISINNSELRLNNIPLSFGGPFAAISASQTRTNLGLGGGITTNRTFVSYNGTNYTTNTVTISNGIITGWAQ